MTSRGFDFLAGADMIMSQIVQYNDWLEEECDNLAREGLRTLVVAKKSLSEEMYAEFQTRLHKAKVAMQDRQERISEVLMSLEKDLELVCLTGTCRAHSQDHPLFESADAADLP